MRTLERGRTSPIPKLVRKRRPSGSGRRSLFPAIRCMLAHYGSTAGQPNPRFLEAQVFKDFVLAPYCKTRRPVVGNVQDCASREANVKRSDDGKVLKVWSGCCVCLHALADTLALRQRLQDLCQVVNDVDALHMVIENGIPWHRRLWSLFGVLGQTNPPLLAIAIIPSTPS